MQETSSSLLERLRHQPDQTSWQQLVELYTPLIRYWLCRHFLRDQDGEDLMQEIFVVVVRRLGDFERQPRVGSFRKWLRTITANCLRDFWRSRKNVPLATGDTDVKDLLNQLEDPESPLSLQWDAEHDNYVAQQLLRRLRPRFEEKTWQAFERVTILGLPARDVATQLGISTNAVFIAKSRVLTALRQEGKGLID